MLFSGKIPLAVTDNQALLPGCFTASAEYKRKIKNIDHMSFVGAHIHSVANNARVTVQVGGDSFRNVMVPTGIYGRRASSQA